MPQSNYKYWFLLIFLLAVFLRVGLSAFNREANDSHETVANLILKTGRLPQKDDCWECFQPKLFHLLFAGAIKILGLANEPGYRQNIAGQALNLIAGIITLAIVWSFLRNLNVRKGKLKVLAFGLVALNPDLLGIHSQATNDTLVILFSTLALIGTYRFLNQEKAVDFGLSILYTLLAISSKTNGWVTAMAILCSFLIAFWIRKESRIKYAAYAVIFCLVVTGLSVLNPLNQYLPNYRDYGSPILLNIDREPLPPIFGKPPAWATGIWYIQDGFFTFKFGELLAHPRLETEPQKISSFQTSFWTVLYGRAHSIHFDNAPPAWSTTDTTLFPLARSIYLLALFPTSLLFLGALLQAWLVMKSIVKQDFVLARQIHFGLLGLAFWGYLAFEILYALEYRSLTVLKAIFTYPALLSFPHLFLWAGDRLSQLISGSRYRWLNTLATMLLIGLLVLYTADVIALIVKLVQHYLEAH